MRLTLITLLLAGVVGCDPTPEEKAAQSQPEYEAASDGDPQSQFEMGQKYDIGDGVPEDLTGAVEWNRKAAEQGDADAHCEVGEAYRDGVGVPEDYTEAVKWYRKAAEQGHAGAQYNLGRMYFEGEGVPEDDVEAYAWTSVAARNGHEDAKECFPIAEAELTREQHVEGMVRAMQLNERIIERGFGGEESAIELLEELDDNEAD